MDLKPNSLVVKLYNTIQFLGHQFWNTEHMYESDNAKYYDSEEEYNKIIEDRNGYLGDGTKTDICSVGRKIFILGPIYTIIYGGFYVLMFYLLFGFNFNSFGLLGVWPGSAMDIVSGQTI